MIDRLSVRVGAVVRLAIGALAFASLTPLAAGAQGHGHGHDGGDAPPGQVPPPGQCRIWFDGLPPGHQPLPSDCETAFRDVPSDARVLVGDGVDARDYDRGDHGNGKHNGWDKKRGRAHDDDDGRDGDRAASPPPPPPPDDCLAYTPDGRCGGAYAPAGGLGALPDMVGALFAAEGRVWPETQRWLGGIRVTAHVDAMVDGRPTRVRWTDPDGRIVQEWVDMNGDGRAEVVRVYRRGVVVRTFRS